MIIWERLRVNTDKVEEMTIYYVIMNPKKNRFELYLPHNHPEDEYSYELWKDGDEEQIAMMLDFYLSLLKTYKKVLPNDYYEKAKPAYYEYFCVSCKLTEFRAEQERRRLRGERSRLRELP